MNASQLHNLIEAHATFPAVITGLLSPLGDELMRERVSSTKWSALEILVHLKDEETEDFRARAQAAVDGRVTETGIDPEAWVKQRNYNAQDTQQVLQTLASERAESCTWLRTLKPESLTSVTRLPQGFEMSAADVIAAWRMHDLLHLRQLTTTLAALHVAQHAKLKLSYAGVLPSS